MTDLTATLFAWTLLGFIAGYWVCGVRAVRRHRMHMDNWKRLDTAYREQIAQYVSLTHQLREKLAQTLEKS